MKTSRLNQGNTKREGCWAGAATIFVVALLAFLGIAAAPVITAALPVLVPAVVILVIIKAANYNRRIEEEIAGAAEDGPEVVRAVKPMARVVQAVAGLFLLLFICGALSSVAMGR